MKILKKITLIFTILVPGLFGMYSCEDYFELTNPPEFPWLNVREFERAAVSPYDYAFHSGWGGVFLMTDRVMNDVMTDIVYHIPSASANWPSHEVYERLTQSNFGRNDDGFVTGYRAIGLINSALDFYYGNDQDPFPEASQEDKENNVDRIIGELHFMRAYTYFHHVMRHCPVPGSPGYSSEQILPLRENFTDADAAMNAEFVSGERIMQLVLEDLEKAKLLLPEQFEEGVHHPSYQYGRVNQFVAHAFLARVYFYIGEKTKCEAEIDTVIDHSNGRYGLTQDPIESFNRSDPSKSDEVIWYALYYDLDKGAIPKEATLFTYLDYRAANGGHGEFHRRSTWHIFCMSTSVAQQIGWMDASGNETAQALADKRYTQLFHRQEAYNGDPEADPEMYDVQYHEDVPHIWGDKYFRAPDGRYGNVPVIRLAEMYLTRAYLRWENGDYQGAADDLNMVRQRAWNSEVGGAFTPVTAAELSAAGGEELIHNERIRELAFEGDRLYYLKSLQLPIPPGDRTAEEGNDPIQFPYDGLYWPIPQSELDFRVEE